MVKRMTCIVCWNLQGALRSSIGMGPNRFSSFMRWKRFAAVCRGLPLWFVLTSFRYSYPKINRSGFYQDSRYIRPCVVWNMRLVLSRNHVYNNRQKSAMLYPFFEQIQSVGPILSMWVLVVLWHHFSILDFPKFLALGLARNGGICTGCVLYRGVLCDTLERLGDRGNCSTLIESSSACR